LQCPPNTGKTRAEVYKDFSKETQDRYNALSRAQRVRISQRRQTFGGFFSAFLGATDPNQFTEEQRKRIAQNFVDKGLAAFNEEPDMVEPEYAQFEGLEFDEMSTDQQAAFNTLVEEGTIDRDAYAESLRKQRYASFGGKDFEKMDEFEQERFNILADQGKIDREEYADMSAEERMPPSFEDINLRKEQLSVIFNAVRDPKEMERILKDRTAAERKEIGTLMESGDLEDLDVTSRLSYLMGTETFRRREDIRTSVESFSDKYNTRDFKEFDISGSREDKREAAVITAVQKLADPKTGMIGDTKAEDIVKVLTKDDKSLQDIFTRLEGKEGTELGLDTEEKEALKKNIDKYSLAIQAQPQAEDLPSILDRMVNVLERLAAKQEAGK
jgi:broad specificity phosphatase PhoE